MMTKTLVVDDHGVFRRGLREIFREAGDVHVAGEASDLASALTCLRSQTFDVVLLDVALPGLDGLEALKQIKKEWPALPVLVLSFFPEEHYAIRVLKAGGAGYLTKESTPAELVEAVRKVAGGGKYIRDSLAETLAQNLDTSAVKPRHFSLSEREFQVFCLLGRGNTVKQISQKLELSDKTVSTYRQRILDKMQMNNTLQIIRYVIENHIEHTDPASAVSVP